MFVENVNRNSYLKLTDEEILNAIEEAVLNYTVDGYKQHYEPVKCPHCDKDTWFDVFDYIAIKLRKINKCTNKI